MKDLLKSTSIMSTTQFSLIAVSIMRNKYLAITIGPDGFGLFSLLTAFFQLGDIIAGAGLGTAVIKYIAESNSNKDQDGVQRVFDFSFSLVFILATIITAVFFIFYPYFKIHFLTPQVLFLHYALFAASYMGTVLSSVFISLLNGLILIKSIAKRNILTSLFSFVSIIVLVYLFDLTGFFISILITSVFGISIFYYESRKHVKIRLRFPNFKDKLSKKLIHFSIVDIFLVLVNIGTSYIQKILVATIMSMSSLGLYAVALSLNKYLSIVADGSQYYFFPKMSENLEIEERNKVLNDYFKMVLISGIIISVSAITLAPFLINILYSKEFLKLNNVFYLFVLAQFLLGIQNGFLYTVVGMVKLKIHSFVTVVTHSIVVIIPYFYLEKYGLYALAWAGIISVVVHISINSIYLKIKQGVSMNLKNLLLFVFGLLLIIFSSNLIDWPILYKIPILLILLSSVAFFIKKSEWVAVYLFIQKKINKKK